MTTRWLIVNADDLGHSAGVNEGIMAAHDRGVVTSASFMVAGVAAADAAALARERPTLSIGLHVDLGEWAPRPDGSWVPLYERVVDQHDGDEVRRALDEQLEAFHDLLGRPPTHLDGHQHVHRDEPLRSAVVAVAGRLGIPARDVCGSVRYEGGFYGQLADGSPWPEGISVDNFVQLVRATPAGWTELACHPGTGAVEPGAPTPYLEARADELATLADPRVAEAIRTAPGLELVAFSRVRWRPSVAAAVPAQP